MKLWMDIRTISNKPLVMIKCGLLLQDTLHTEQWLERVIITGIKARFSNQYLILSIDWTVGAVISRVIRVVLYV